MYMIFGDLVFCMCGNNNANLTININRSALLILMMGAYGVLKNKGKLRASTKLIDYRITTACSRR